jgi:hypothetical protein
MYLYNICQWGKWGVKVMYAVLRKIYLNSVQIFQEYQRMYLSYESFVNSKMQKVNLPQRHSQSIERKYFMHSNGFVNITKFTKNVV